MMFNIALAVLAISKIIIAGGVLRESHPRTGFFKKTVYN